MSLFVERTLDTEVGQIRIAITRAEHVSVEGQPVVRDTKFNCHLHFWRQADGTYAVREQDRPSMSRAWRDGMTVSEANKPAPPTYFTKVLAAWTSALNTFLSNNAGLLDEAEEADIEREIGTAQGKVDDLHEKLREAQSALAALEEKRRKHQLKDVRANTFKVELPCDRQNCAISYPHGQHS